MASAGPSAIVAQLLAGCAPLDLAPAVVPQPPAADAVTLAMARQGDEIALIQMAVHYFREARAGASVDGLMLDDAETAARAAYEAGSSTAAYLLAEILVFRAGVLHALGLRRVASFDVREAQNLFTGLADDGSEEAATAIVRIGDTLASTGLRPATDSEVYSREIW